jgi:hypothetical protein
MPRRALAPALLLLGSLALTAACSTGSPPADSAPSADGPTRTGGNDTGSRVDLSNLKGVDIVSDSSTDRSCPWATSYPDVPGAGSMTAAMKKDVEGRLAVFLGEDTGGQATGCGGMDGLEGPELNVSFSFLVTSGDVLGVRLTTVDRTSNADGVGTRAYWYDGAAKGYRPSPGLIADGSRHTFVSTLKKRLEKREGVTPETVAALDDQESRDSYLDDMAFTADGDLKVDFDRGTVGVPPAASPSPSPRRPSPRGCPTSAAAPSTRPPTRTTSSTSVPSTPPPRPSPPSRTLARTPRTAPRPSASP